MDKNFSKELVGDWLSWLGSPMLYDAGLCVNRSLEEHLETNKYSIRFSFSQLN